MTRRGIIVGVTPAGEDHQVLSVKSSGEGAFVHRRTPCGECPWRLDKTGSFPPEAFAHSATTAHDMAMTTFACHMTGAAKPATCAGFLLMNADHNLSVRLALMSGRYDPSRISDGGHELHRSYRAMAVANGVPSNSPTLSRCRENGYGR